MTSPKLVIVGRPNVGKSTLFNRLYGRKRALVHDLPGVTRDRLEEKAEWWVKAQRYEIDLVDTGGLGGEKFSKEISRQVQTALEHADIVLALFDGQAGYTALDQEVIHQMVRSGLKDREIPIVGVINKVDADLHEEFIHDFYASGLDPLITISAEHGRGIEDLQEKIIEILTEHDKVKALGTKEEEIKIPKIAIVGRPNVGKSTLTNAMLDEDRMITSNIAGTTIDAVDSLCELNGYPFCIIDTAGIRRKSKTEQGVEVLSVVQARKALERCDLALLVVDGETGTMDQDEKISGLIEEVGCSVILVVNKWDTQKRNQKFTQKDAVERIHREMAYFKWAPVMFVSAKEKTGLDEIGELINDVLEQKKLKITTHEFSEWVRAESEIHNPGNVKFYMCHQSGRYPPTFVCHVSNPDKVHFSLKRHIINAIRERWGYMGSPIRLHFVEGKSRTGPRRKNDRSLAKKAKPAATAPKAPKRPARATR
jgi:GTP-binding protein